ncbi:VPA1267 family protein [Pseudomonas sivasensis]|uniref:VPA1267 family protein n=1 Tax=Pseudomonas sivasensis TaxID=1880678 RepID=UPI003BA212A3
MSNGQQIAAHNVAIFNAWVEGKTDADFRSIIHRGVLSRSAIALDCGFAKSALLQNPRIKLLLAQLETDLRAKGVLPPPSEAIAPSDLQKDLACPKAQASLPKTKFSAPSDLETKLQRLQTENALQRAEIEELRRQLKQYTSIHKALSSTGRMPR